MPGLEHQLPTMLAGLEAGNKAALQGFRAHYDGQDPSAMSRVELEAAHVASIMTINGLATAVDIVLEQMRQAQTSATLTEHQLAETTKERDRLKRTILERERGIDSLTYLGNLAAFTIDLEAAAAEDRPLYLAILDLENLHGINEFYGYESGGDAILRLPGELIQSDGVRTGGSMVWREKDAYRMGGDEFAIISRHLVRRSAAEPEQAVINDAQLALEEQLDRAIVEHAETLVLKKGDQRPHVGVTVVVKDLRPGDDGAALKTRTRSLLCGQRRTIRSLFSVDIIMYRMSAMTIDSVDCSRTIVKR